MPKTQGCFTIVISRERKILLVKRKDYPVWDLPGGALYEQEFLESCAIRETEEETGYIITITRKTGEYYKTQYDDMQHIFIGELEGGLPIKDVPETAQVEWFSPNKLPLWMIPNRKKQIKDYLHNKNTVIRDSIT